MNDSYYEEFKHIPLNVIPDTVDKRDYNVSDYEMVSTSELPEVLDLRDKMMPVRNQGGQGSCVAMACAAMKEYQEQLSEYFSPQFFYNNRNNQSSSGMNMRDSMVLLMNIGICFEKNYLYGRIEPKSAIPQELYDEAYPFRCLTYANIGTVDDAKKSLVTYGTCVIAVPVYNYGGRMWKQLDGQTYKGGHCMAIVGYNQDGFIIRNSWGPKWNGDGHTIMSYDDFGELSKTNWNTWTTIDIVIPKKLPVFGYIIKTNNQILLKGRAPIMSTDPVDRENPISVKGYATKSADGLTECVFIIPKFYKNYDIDVPVNTWKPKVCVPCHSSSYFVYHQNTLMIVLRFENNEVINPLLDGTVFQNTSSNNMNTILDAIVY